MPSSVRIRSSPKAARSIAAEALDAAATMIGQKTPVSAQSRLPSTPRTPIGDSPDVGAHAHHAVGLSGASGPGGGARTNRCSTARPRRRSAQLRAALGDRGDSRRRSRPALHSPIATAFPGSPVCSARAGEQCAFECAAAELEHRADAEFDRREYKPGRDDAGSARCSATAAPASTPNAAMPPPPPPPTAEQITDASGAPAARASQAGVEALRDLPAAQAAQNAPGAAHRERDRSRKTGSAAEAAHADHRGRRRRAMT